MEMKLKFKVNNQSGQFLVRSKKINNLPKDIILPNSVTTCFDILLVMNDPNNENKPTACYCDFDDFRKVFGCGRFEFEALLRNWLFLLGPNQNDWLRIDIEILSPENKA